MVAARGCCGTDIEYPCLAVPIPSRRYLPGARGRVLHERCDACRVRSVQSRVDHEITDYVRPARWNGFSMNEWEGTGNTDQMILSRYAGSICHEDAPVRRLADVGFVHPATVHSLGNVSTWHEFGTYTAYFLIYPHYRRLFRY